MKKARWLSLLYRRLVLRFSVLALKLRLDPWATEYNTSYFVEQNNESTAENVDTAIEMADWQAIVANLDIKNFPYERLLFIDGSRRIEARVLLEDEEQQVAFGALASYGIGAVDCCPHQSRVAKFVDLQAIGLNATERVCVVGRGQKYEDFDILPRLTSQLGNLKYKTVSTAEQDVDAVVRELQDIMLKAEHNLAANLESNFKNALIISDGPRPYMGKTPVKSVVGYVKTIHKMSISKKELTVVRELEQGERSPIYLIGGDDKSKQIFEWFLRLRDPNPWLFTLAGMVRLQAYAGSRPEEKLEEVKALADYLSLLLPKFASQQHQDPRAPQQLLPVRGLEAELRRNMGNPQIIRRRITEHLSFL